MSPGVELRLNGRVAGVWLLLLAGFIGLYACGGGLAVGRIQARDESGRSALSGVQAFALEPVASLVSSDSGSPAWSPDSAQVAFAERSMGRIVLLDVDSQATTTAYEAGSAPVTVGDARYNLEDPVFLDRHRLLSGPAWGGTLTSTDSWTELLLTDLDGNTSQAFGQWGSKPQVNRVTGELLLETSDGMRRVDANGQEIGTYPKMYFARWDPAGDGFAALEYPDYYGESPTLVRVRADGATERLEKLAFQPAWHPEGTGLAFVRAGGGRTYFDPNWEFGTLYYYDLATGQSKVVAERARSPLFVPGSGLVVFESQQGLGVSDLVETRYLREVVLSRPTPSPDGAYLAGVAVRPGQAYYTSVELKVFAIADR